MRFIKNTITDHQRMMTNYVDKPMKIVEVNEMLHACLQRFGETDQSGETGLPDQVYLSNQEGLSDQACESDVVKEIHRSRLCPPIGQGGEGKVYPVVKNDKTAFVVKWLKKEMAPGKYAQEHALIQELKSFSLSVRHFLCIPELLSNQIQLMDYAQSDLFKCIDYL